MALEKWVVIGSKYCELIETEADLLELRVYPSDELPDIFGAGYVVKGKKCTAGIECNMAGVPCELAFNNPEVNRFSE